MSLVSAAITLAMRHGLFDKVLIPSCVSSRWISFIINAPPIMSRPVELICPAGQYNAVEN